MEPRILTVLLEYSPTQQRVMVRGVWPEGEQAYRKPLEAENQQNYVRVFEGVDMKANVGFAGLMPA